MQTTSPRKYNRRTASNGLRSALLNFYKKEGAKEYKESKQVNEKDEVVERQFQMPPRVFGSLFGEVQFTEKSEEDRQETSSTASEVYWLTGFLLGADNWLLLLSIHENVTGYHKKEMFLKFLKVHSKFIVFSKKIPFFGNFLSTK